MIRCLTQDEILDPPLGEMNANEEEDDEETNEDKFSYDDDDVDEDDFGLVSFK
jgi:hypothetical protein